MRTWIEINKASLTHNIKTIKSILPSGQKLAVVVKGNAYGHGLIPVSLFLNTCDEISYLLTAGLKEALELRHNGIKKPIFVMSYIDEDPKYALELDIDLPITNRAAADHLQKIAQTHNTYFNVHIKIDSGLSRLGLQVNHAFDDILHISKYKNLMIKSVFTHLADNKHQLPEYTHHQIQQFHHIVENLRLTLKQPFMAHAQSSSALLMTKNHYFYDLARIGTSLYGLYKSPLQQKVFIDNGLSLKPVLTWKSKIIELKTMPCGTAISYGCTYTTTKQTVIAIIPIGYWDGYPARLSNNSFVYIRDKRCPILGTITMNMIIVDVSEIENVALYEHVVLIGDDLGITISELASRAGNINIELLAQLHPHIERTVVEEMKSSQHSAQNSSGYSRGKPDTFDAVSL